MAYREIRAEEFTPIDIARFWALVEQTWPNACWLWKGRVKRKWNSRNGYGCWKWGKGVWAAHRIAFVMAGNYLSADLTLDHVAARGCTNSLCCNPLHLEPVTSLENSLRSQGMTTAKNRHRCKMGHRRKLGNDCIFCRRIWQRKYKKERRAKEREAGSIADVRPAFHL